VIILLLKSAWHHEKFLKTSREKRTTTRAALARHRLPNGSVIKSTGPIGRPVMERGRLRLLAGAVVGRIFWQQPSARLDVGFASTFAE
jgi:hypothetical protein